MWLLIFSHSYTPTALTLKNVLSELTALDWETLCDPSGVLWLPHSQRRKIENEFSENEQRKTAAVLFWLTSNPLASWRWLIWQLDVEKRYSLSERLRPYAEKLTGMFGCSLYCHWVWTSVTSTCAHHLRQRVINFISGTMRRIAPMRARSLKHIPCT